MSSGSSLCLPWPQSITGLGEGPGQSVGFCPAPNYDTDLKTKHSSENNKMSMWSSIFEAAEKAKALAQQAAEQGLARATVLAQQAAESDVYKQAKVGGRE